MDIGLLWFDNDVTRDLPTKLARAQQHYQHKFGHAPQVCFVNPAMLGNNVPADEQLVISGLEIVARPTVLMHHFWIGMREPAAVPA